MLTDVAMSGSQVRSQQIGEAELTLGERRQELLQQFRSRPLVFLERYHVSVNLVMQGWTGQVWVSRANKIMGPCAGLSESFFILT